MVFTWTIFWSFCHRQVCRCGWRWHGPFSGNSVTMRTTVANGGDMDHFLAFLSLSGLPRRMMVAWIIFWTFCHCQVYRGIWQWHRPFSGLSVTVRFAVADACHVPSSGLSVTVKPATADDGGMDHFLAFLSLSGLPRRMMVAWIIFWTFCHCQFYRSIWQWHRLFSGLSVTVKSAAADDGGMDLFLVLGLGLGLCHHEDYHSQWR